jgi:hypothetical protein
MILIANADDRNERPLYCGVACVLHFSAVPRKKYCFSQYVNTAHCMSFSLRFFLIRRLYLEDQKVVRAQKLLLNILCSKFSRLLNGAYADY